MKRSTVIWLIIIVVIIVIGLWYWGSTGTQNPGSASTTTTEYGGTPNTTSTPVSSATPVDLNTASTGTLGTYLVAENGMTLYRYTKDKPGVSNCTGQCAAIWPPYTIPPGETSSSLSVAANVPGQIGTIMRADGTTQITYNNTPLYYYSNDQAPGDTTGENVAGTWFVVAASTASSSSVPIE
jgi:predicted lipoprotein with Yx(FWY)xxD motif